MSARKDLPSVIDPLRRYPVNVALELLGCGRKFLYDEIAAGRIKTIAEGSTCTRTSRTGKVYERRGRRFIPGSEIVRLSAVPTSEAA